MTQIQTQIQGPQLFAQPTQPVMYQETETILPRPGVSIGLGIDWGSIGQSVAGAAIEVTKAYNDYQFDKKASLLERMSDGYQRDISAALDVNDTETISKIKSDWSSQVKELLGYDPNTDTPFSQADRKLINQFRSGMANIDAKIEETQRGWSDNIALEGVNRLTLDLEKQVQDGKITPEDAYNEILTAYSTTSRGLGFDEPLPDSGFSVGQRRALLAMREQAVKFNEMKLKAEANKKTSFEVGEEQARSYAMLADNELALAENSRKAAEDASVRGDIQTEQSQLAQLYRHRMNANHFMMMARSTLVRGAAQDFNASEQDLTDPETYYENAKLNNYDPRLNIDDEWFKNIVLARAKPEVISAFTQSEQKESKLSTGSFDYGFKAAQEIEKQQFEAANNKAKAIADTASARLAQLDGQIAGLSEEDPLRYVLMGEKTQQIYKLQDAFREQLDAFIPDEIKEYKPTFRQLLVGGWLQGVSEHLSRFNLDFTPGSIDTLTLLVGNNPAIQELYTKQIGYVSSVIKEHATTPVGKSDGSGSRKSYAAKQEDDALYSLFIRGESLPETVTQSRVIEWSNRALAERLGNGKLTPIELAEMNPDRILELASAGDNTKIFNLQHLVYLPVWKKVLDKANSFETEEEGAKYVQTFLSTILSEVRPGVKHTEIESGPNHYEGALKYTIDTMVEYIRDPSARHGVTKTMLLYLPKNLAFSIIDRAGKELNSDTPWLDSLATLVRTYNDSGRRQQPFEFVQANGGWIKPRNEFKRIQLQQSRRIQDKDKPTDAEKPLLEVRKKDKEVTDYVVTNMQLPGFDSNKPSDVSFLNSNGRFRTIVDDAILMQIGDREITELTEKDIEEIQSRVSAVINTLDLGLTDNGLINNYRSTLPAATTEIPGSMVRNIGTAEGRKTYVLDSGVADTTEDPVMFLHQFGKVTEKNRELSVDPFIGSIILGAESQNIPQGLLDRIGVSTTAVSNWPFIASTAVEGLPRTNATSLAAIAALKELNKKTFNSTQEALEDLRTTTRRIYNDITQGVDNPTYQTRVVSRPMYFGSSDSIAPTIEVIGGDGKVVASMQPNRTGIGNTQPTEKNFKDFDPVAFYKTEVMGEVPRKEKRQTGNLWTPTDFIWSISDEMGDIDIYDVVTSGLTEKDRVIANFLRGLSDENVVLPVYEELQPWYNDGAEDHRIVFKKTTKNGTTRITREHESRRSIAPGKRSDWYTQQSSVYTDRKPSILTVTTYTGSNKSIGRVPDYLKNQPKESPFRMVPVQTEFDAMISELETQNTYRSVFTRNLVEPEPEQGGPFFEQPVMDMFGDIPDQNPLDFVPLSVEEEMLGYVKDAELQVYQREVEANRGMRNRGGPIPQEPGGPIYPQEEFSLYANMPDIPDKNPLDFVPLSVEEEMLGYVKDAENASIQADVKSRQEFLRKAQQPPSFSASLNKLWNRRQPGRRDPYDINKWEPVSLDSNMPIELAKQYPNLAVGPNNPVKTIITYDRQTRTFALVPDRFNGDSVSAEFWRRKTKKQLGLFKSREDALLYQERLEEFLNHNR